MSWLSLGLALLKLANYIFSWLREKGLIDAGADRAIAAASAQILAKTLAAKEIADHLAPLTEAQVDAELKDLEPK